MSISVPHSQMTQSPSKLLSLTCPLPPLCSLWLLPQAWPPCWYHLCHSLRASSLSFSSNSAAIQDLHTSSLNFQLPPATTLCLPFTARLLERKIYANVLHFFTSHFSSTHCSLAFIPLTHYFFQGQKCTCLWLYTLRSSSIFSNAVYSQKCLWLLWVVHPYFSCYHF